MRSSGIGLALFVGGVLLLAGAGIGIEYASPSLIELFLRGIKPGDIPRLALSAILLAAALFVILTKRYSPQDKHWAYGTIGTIVGFWLKG
jgi:hypothetical protein